MPLFRARGLTVRADERVLLADLDLTLEPGDVLALSGPSGAGKTTALRALAGLSVAEGSIELDGKPPADHGWPSYRRRVGFLAQRPVVLDGTVEDNLALAFRFASAPDPFDPDRARDLLEALLLSPSILEQEARTLSEGERQRVGLVRTLLVEPTLLLLDEPTSALDPAATEAVESLIQAHIDEAERAAILVSHDTAQRQRLATHTIELTPPSPESTPEEDA